MKKQKIKKFLLGKIYVFFTIFLIFGTAFATFTSYLITPQISTNPGSSNSIISFTGTIDKQGYYVNDENNSTIINNYFKGYYYDNLYGYFKLDWSSNKNENVRIIGSTNKCNGGYGYKLGGKAYNEFTGYIEFYLDENNYVYYCSSDKKLHGNAYSKMVGLQNFEGINLEIVVEIDSLAEKVSNNIFKNDTSEIEKNNSSLYTEQNVNNISGDIIQIETTKESIFYIIK